MLEYLPLGKAIVTLRGPVEWQLDEQTNATNSNDTLRHRALRRTSSRSSVVGGIRMLKRDAEQFLDL